MNWKRTLFFALILTSLASFYFLKLYHNPVTDRLPAFSLDAVTRYVLEFQNDQTVNRLSIFNRSKNTTILFEKDSKNNWQIGSPVCFPADPLIVDGFVTLLKLTPRLRHLSIDQLSLKEFGFDQPRLRICIGFSNQKNRCLLVGNDSAVGQGAYAKWEDESTYFLVEEIFLKSFDKTLYTVRKKQIFNLLDDEIASIRFKSPKKEIEMVHQQKHWMLKKPESEITPQAVDAVLTELNGLYVKEFLDGQKLDEFKSKLKEPIRIICVRYQNGSEQMLIQGQEASGRDADYARLSESQTIFLISASKLNHLEEVFSKLGA